jgi:hypothetical protein
VEAVERRLALLDEAAGKVEHSRGRILAAAGEHDPALVVDDERGRRRLRIRVVDEAALGALDAPHLATHRRRADRTAPPDVELAHGSQQ